jgi:exodeoxyribonuclease III
MIGQELTALPWLPASASPPPIVPARVSKAELPIISAARCAFDRKHRCPKEEFRVDLPVPRPLGHGAGASDKTPMRIATWNVNSIKQRVDNLVTWLAERQPDVVCLQETKCVDESFPREPLEAAGYNVVCHGQKTFNGVAILSKLPFDEIATGLSGDDADPQARFLEAVISTPSGVVRVATIYLPNGNPPGTDKYTYKINWMNRLLAYAQERLALQEPLIMAGDFNVIPAPADVHDPAAWAGDALFLPQTRERFRALSNLGLTDAIRAVSDTPGLYTFWDYQAGCWPKNKGLRIDHLLLSPQASDRLVAAGIDKHVRGWERPSDHVPVWADLAIDPR